MKLKYSELGRYTHRVREECSVYCEPLRKISVDVSPFWAIKDGEIIAREGYCWDSASGPTIDHGTMESKIGSLFHDILYQAIEQGHLDESYYKAADDLLYTLLVGSGMWEVRAKYWHWAVRKFGSFTQDPGRKEYKILVATCHEPAE